jgi:SRSO17 transposase
MKTYTPELDPAVLSRLRDYATLFADEFPHARPALWASVYLQGLLIDGARKSIEPLSGRVTLPEELAVKDKDQALQQFVNHSPWDEAKVLKRYRSELAGTFPSPEAIFVLDDVSFAKQGTHAVGVQRQYGGALGQKANCQVAVRVHYVSPKGHYPLDLRLDLPDSWLQDEARLDKARAVESHGSSCVVSHSESVAIRSSGSQVPKPPGGCWRGLLGIGWFPPISPSVP